MSFDSSKQNTISDKIILIEIDFPILIERLFVDAEGIWRIILTPAEVYIFGGVFNPDRNLTDYHQVPSVKVIFDGEISNYTETSNRPDLLTQEKSFYYDSVTTTLYFHFENFDPPQTRVIKMGTIIGFCNKYGEINKGRYNDMLYDERVNNVPSISFKKDPVSFGILEHQNANIGFNNRDGYFDNIQFGIKQISRMETRILFGFDGLPYADFQQVYQSIIKDFKRTFSDYTLNTIDFRNQLNRSIPVNKFTLAEYPLLNENNIDKFKPVGYGWCFNTPTICVDEEGTLDNYTFFFVDTFYNAASDLTVFADGVEITPVSINYINGTFVLTAAQCGMDEDSLLEITATFKANALENPCDIIIDLASNWGGIAAIDTNYNLLEIEKETNKNSNYKASLYIDDSTKIIDAIGKICTDFNGIFFCSKNGLYTIKSYDVNKKIKKTIFNYDWESDPTETNPQDDFLSSVTIKYGKDITKDEYKQHVNNDYRQDAINNYSIENSRVIETTLSDRDSAILLADELMTIAKDIVPNIKRKTYMAHFDVELMDFIIACHDRDIESTDFKVWEIVGIDYDLNDYTIEFTMRYVKEADIYLQGEGFSSGLYKTYGFNDYSGFGVTEYRGAA
jgi:hypothetical protein